MKTKNLNSSLNIAFVLPSLSAGGAERVLITLMNGLGREKYTPSLISVISKGTLGDLVAKDIPIVNLNCIGVMFSLPKLYATLRNTKPDIVVSTIAHLNFALLLLRPFFPDTKFIVREAITPSFFFRTRPVIAPLLKFLYAWLYKRADVIISPSQVIIDEFKGDLPLADKEHVLLYNPVNTALIEANLQDPSPDVRDVDVRFVASGRLQHQKGFDRLIESLTDFKPSFSWSLYILGDGPEKSALETLVTTKGLQSQIFLLGHNHAPWLHYRKADMFLLPSRWEGLPNVALESLACGTPVIAMKEAGGIAEIAALAKPNAVQLANTMQNFLRLMENANTKSESPSLLPDDFSESRILQHFDRILFNLATA